MRKTEGSPRDDIVEALATLVLRNRPATTASRQGIPPNVVGMIWADDTVTHVPQGRSVQYIDGVEAMQSKDISVDH